MAGATYHAMGGVTMPSTAMVVVRPPTETRTVARRYVVVERLGSQSKARTASREARSAAAAAHGAAAFTAAMAAAVAAGAAGAGREAAVEAEAALDACAAAGGEGFDIPTECSWRIADNFFDTPRPTDQPQPRQAPAPRDAENNATT